MKVLTIAALVAAQLVSTAPAAAAELHDNAVSSRQTGTFAGARIRVPFGGRNGGQVRAGLSLTAMQKADRADGRSRTRFAEGIELGLGQAARPELRLGGVPLSKRLAAAGQEGDGKKDSVSKTALKGGAILLIIGAVVVAGLVVALVAHCETTSQCEDD